MKADTREMLGNLFKGMREATTQSSREEHVVVCIPADQGDAACRQQHRPD